MNLKDVLTALLVVGCMFLGSADAIGAEKGDKGKAVASEVSPSAASEKEALQWKAKYLMEYMSSRTATVNEWDAAKKELYTVQEKLKGLEAKAEKK